MKGSVVSVVCLCYNQERFVEAAIQSVLHQTYQPIQLIIVDDASTDNSVQVIKDVLKSYPHVQFLELEENNGNCKAFNRGLAIATGAYIIDLAADDVLLPNRVEKGVQVLSEKGEAYGVHFSDAEIVDEYGAHRYFHSDRFPHETIPQGNVYRDIISRYFICSPTVMFTRQVADVLGGYDETLAYEDFDFWIRSSRAFQYVYSSDVLVMKRVFSRTLSTQQFRLFTKHSRSTYKVCKKILRLNNSRDEQRALRYRIIYELKLNLRLLNVGVAMKFFFLLFRNERKKYN